MKAFSVSTKIKAAPEVIWKLLTDAPAWPSWNPTVDKVDGKIAPGEKVTVYAKINPGRAFPVRVSEFVPNRKMVWTGGMPLGLFKGERTFSLVPGAAGAVEFSMREIYTGLMAPLIGKSIPDLQPAFDLFAAALKKRAENDQ
jgi:hypothetical protein